MPALVFSNCCVLSFSSAYCLSRYIFDDPSAYVCSDGSAINRIAFTECLLSERDFDMLCCFRSRDYIKVFACLERFLHA